jgi:hypothetical protein
VRRSPGARGAGRVGARGAARGSHRHGGGVPTRLEAIRAAHADDSKPYLFAGCFELIQPFGVGAKGEVFEHITPRRTLLRGAQAAQRQVEGQPRGAGPLRTRGPSAQGGESPRPARAVECRTSDEAIAALHRNDARPGKPAGEYCIGKNRLPPAEVITSESASRVPWRPFTREASSTATCTRRTC